MAHLLWVDRRLKPAADRADKAKIRTLRLGLSIIGFTFGSKPFRSIYILYFLGSDLRAWRLGLKIPGWPIFGLLTRRNIEDRLIVL